MDETLLLAANQGLGSPWLDPLMQWLSAKAGFGIPLLLGLAGWLAWRHRPLFGLALLLTVGLSDASGQFLKDRLQQPRPCAEAHLELRGPTGRPPRCPGDTSGMPSNHAMNFFAATAFLIAVGASRGLGAALALIALLVALSRVYLGVHYPSQVLAGALLGLAIGAALGWLTRRLGGVSSPKQKTKVP